MLISASDRAIKRKKVFQKSVPWWTAELTKSKKRVNRLRRLYREENDTQLRVEAKTKYRNSRRNYTRELTNTRKASWRNFVETDSDKNPHGLIYKMANEKMCT